MRARRLERPNENKVMLHREHGRFCRQCSTYLVAGAVINGVFVYYLVERHRVLEGKSHGSSPDSSLMMTTSESRPENETSTVE